MVCAGNFRRACNESGGFALQALNSEVCDLRAVVSELPRNAGSSLLSRREKNPTEGERGASWTIDHGGGGGRGARDHI